MRKLALTVFLVMLLFPASAYADWDYADRVVENNERYWRDDRYTQSRFHLTVGMLTIFSSARMAGHEGPSRKDERIEPLARSLLTSPTYITTPEELAQAKSTNPHIPGFTTNFSGKPGYQHVAISGQASKALGLAVKSGALPDELRQEISQKLGAVANGEQFTYPKIEASQINWPMMVWLGYARASGDYLKAGSQTRSYLERWIQGMHRPMPGYQAPNLSPGMGLNYFPESPAYSLTNQTSSTEYASVIFSGFDSYPELLEQGMPRLPEKSEAQMRRFADRIIQGEWTHSGWPNWDTGLGYERWQLINYFAWCANGLLALSSTPHLVSESTQLKARYLLQKALDRFPWLIENGFSGSTRYGVKSDFTRPDDTLIAEARLGAIAAQAALRGVNEQGEEPGMWGWWDRSRSRLTVSSPHYSSAAITPFNRIGYGGLDPARILDSQGRVLTSLGANRDQAGMSVIIGGHFKGSSMNVSRASVQGWKASAGKRIFLSGSSGKVSAQTSFENHEIKTRYRIPQKAWGRLRIPLWGKISEPQLEEGKKTLVVKTENDEGGKLTIRVKSSRKPMPSFLTITPPRMSPRTQTVLLIKGLGKDTQVTYQPES